MTCHDDPNFNRPMVRDDSSLTGFVIAALAILAIVGVMFYAFGGNSGTQTATTIERPAANSPATTGVRTNTTKSAPATTGSGTTPPASLKIKKPPLTGGRLSLV